MSIATLDSVKMFTKPTTRSSSKAAPKVYHSYDQGFYPDDAARKLMTKYDCRATLYSDGVVLYHEVEVTDKDGVYTASVNVHEFYPCDLPLFGWDYLTKENSEVASIELYDAKHLYHGLRSVNVHHNVCYQVLENTGITLTQISLTVPDPYKPGDFITHKGVDIWRQDCTIMGSFASVYPTPNHPYHGFSTKPLTLAKRFEDRAYGKNIAVWHGVPLGS